MALDIIYFNFLNFIIFTVHLWCHMYLSSAVPFSDLFPPNYSANNLIDSNFCKISLPHFQIQVFLKKITSMQPFIIFYFFQDFFSSSCQ